MSQIVQMYRFSDLMVQAMTRVPAAPTGDDVTNLLGNFMDASEAAKSLATELADHEGAAAVVQAVTELSDASNKTDNLFHLRTADITSGKPAHAGAIQAELDHALTLQAKISDGIKPMIENAHSQTLAAGAEVQRATYDGVSHLVDDD